MLPLCPLVQIIARLSTSVSSVSPWESCALSLIEKHRPSSVFFFCKNPDLCPSNSFYKAILIAPYVTILGLESHQYPTLKESDLVFVPVNDEGIHWSVESVQKYLMGGKNSFKIVVVIDMSRSLSHDLKNMQILFSKMWQSGIVTCVVLLKNNVTTNMYTYLPFKKSGACQDTSPVLLGECASVSTSLFDLTFKVRNLNKCPIRISLVDDSPFIRIPLVGRFEGLVREVAHRLNFTIELMTSETEDRGAACGPKEYTGLRGDVASGKAHIIVAALSRKECSKLEYIGLSYMMCMAWCTPVMPADDFIFSFLLRQFDPEVWGAVVGATLGVVATIFLHQAVVPERVTVRDGLNLSFVMFATVHLDFQSSRLRLVAAVWLLSCLVIRTAYEGEMKSQSAVPDGGYVIDSLEELADSSLALCGTSATLQLLDNEEDPVMKQLKSRATICKGVLSDLMLSTAEQKNVAILTPDLRCSIVSSEIKDDTKLLNSRSGGCLKIYEVTPFVTLPGCPFIPQIKEIQRRCFEAGLIEKWMDLRPAPKEIARKRAFSINHLLPALFALCLGSLISLITFLIENMWFLMKSKLVKSTNDESTVYLEIK